MGGWVGGDWGMWGGRPRLVYDLGLLYDLVICVGVEVALPSLHLID